MIKTLVVKVTPFGGEAIREKFKIDLSPQMGFEMAEEIVGQAAERTGVSVSFEREVQIGVYHFADIVKNFLPPTLQTNLNLEGGIQHRLI